ncbi:MAG TPA: hypothetical protein VMB79_05060 [Jatrophihabitans sp.]|nr:hypothetical protein [Jatrophihabitans sp.]
MEKTIRIGRYAPETGIQLEWLDGYELSVEIRNSEVVLRGNSAGLLSLAQHLATLAADVVPSGSHLHLDQYNGLEDGSGELVLERIE